MMPYLVLLLAVAFAASPFLVPDFGGFDADRYPVPQIDPAVQPAGYAFAIWGPIYAWLVISAVTGVIRRDAPDWQAMRAPLAVSLAVGAVWLAVAVRSPVWATILIWVMLVAALAALWRSPRLDPWAAALPVGLYTGWLSAASFVALGLFLAGYGLLPEMAAAVIMILAATCLAVVVQLRLDRAPTYGLAVIWALVAIIVQNGANIVAVLAGLGIAAMIWPTLRAVRGM